MIHAALVLAIAALFDHGWAIPPLMVTGRAVDAEGHPIAGVTIELADFEEGEQWLERPSTVTDADGGFRLGPLERIGEETIVSGSPDKGATLLWSHVIRDRENGVDDVGDLIVERTDPWITGRVVGVDKKPVAGAEVVAFNHASRAFARSDAEGRFAIGGVFDFRVVVDARTESQATSHVTSVPNRDAVRTDFEIVLDARRSSETEAPISEGSAPETKAPPPERQSRREGAWIEGHVTESGRRLTGVDGYRRHCRLELCRREPEHARGATMVLVEFDGSFRGGPYAAGTFTVNYVDSKQLPRWELRRDGARVEKDGTAHFDRLQLKDGETAHLVLNVTR